VKLGGYDEAARDAIAAYEAFQAAERRRTCKHPRRMGSGSVSSDGSSSGHYYCPDCHQSWNYETPPSAESERLELHNGGNN
jgi:transposase-like protein